jgi:hypothetical protein
MHTHATFRGEHRHRRGEQHEGEGSKGKGTGIHALRLGASINGYSAGLSFQALAKTASMQSIIF